MPPTTTKDVQDLLKRADDVAAKAQTENRDLTDEERKEVTDLFNRAKTANDDRKLVTDIKTFADQLEEDTVPDAEAGGGAQLGDGKTIGERFIKSAAWSDFVKSNPSGFEGRKGIQSPPVGFKGLKDLVTGVSDTSAGALVDTDLRGLLDPGTFARELTVLDAITRGSTTSDLVEFVRVTGVTNAAAAVPEATQVASAGDEAADKPESGVAMVRVQAPVVTIAHWIPATKRSLSDAAQVRTLIDNFLRYGLNEALEDEVISGTGGDGFTGILNTSGRQTQAWVVDFGDDRDLLVTARKAKTKIQTVGRARPTAYMFHPNDLERLDLLRDDNGMFYFGGPSAGGASVLWRVPTIMSEGIPEGTGLLGDFRQAVLWDREAASISVSDSHNDFFTRNLVAILAELRAAFGVLRPAAFVEIDLTVGS